MKHLNIGGNSKLVSFEKFIVENVPYCRDQEKELYKEFNTLISVGLFGETVYLEGEEEATYQRCISMYCSTVDSLKASLISQCKLLPTQYMKNIKEIGEDLAVKSITEYGIPDFFVQIAPRLYLVTCASDWRVYEDKEGNRAVCGSAKMRNLLVKVERMTEIEKDILVEKYKKDNGLD